jgi:predicted component of viral defense system (DUF524 family)
LLLSKAGAQDAPLRVWPSGPELPVSTIQENQEYIFELRDVDDPWSAELLLDDEPLRGLRPPNRTSARWSWCPGFYAGATTIRLEVSGHSEEFELVTDPDAHKLARSEFDLMVREILQDTQALFSLSAFRTSVAKGVGDTPPPLARLQYLRSRIERLEQVVRSIDKSPRRSLGTSTAWVKPHQAKTLSSKEILRSLRSASIQRIADETNLPPRLRGMLPRRFLKDVKVRSLDLPEHRDMKRVLVIWSEWLESAAGTLARAGAADAERRNVYAKWSGKCSLLSRRLTQLLRLPLFDEVGESNKPISLTEVYRREPRYREFFELAQDIELGIGNIHGDFLDIPIARTFELYELWCFLRIVSAAQLVFGIGGIDPTTLFRYGATTGALTLSRSAVEIPIGKGRTLSFQRQYREFWLERNNRGSFSRSLRPDVSLEFHGPGAGPKVLIVLDAKYRIEEQLNDAISSIHTYRDALVEAVGSEEKLTGIVVGAYLLTPHINDDVSPWKESLLPGRLFHPEYRRTFRFGAVTLKPGMTLEQVGASLSSIVNDAS